MTLYKWSQTASADATVDSTINWAEGQAPSSVNDSVRAMMAATAKYRDDIAGAIVTGGTSTGYTVSSYQAFDTLANLNGQTIAFTPHVTNGATVTLNVDGLGAKPLRSAPAAELLAGILQTYYMKDPAQAVDQKSDQWLPVTPAMLLTQIVRITGRVPDFVRTMNKEQLEHLLKNWDKRSTENGKGSLIVAPYYTIKWICEAELPTTKWDEEVARGLLARRHPPIRLAQEHSRLVRDPLGGRLVFLVVLAQPSSPRISE